MKPTRVRKSTPRRQVAAFAIICLIAASAGELNAWEPKNKAVYDGKRPLFLKSDILSESSGLAFSNIDGNCFWSHNDSGGKPRLLAFDEFGKCCGRVSLKGIKANDWEAMSSFDDDGPRILVADVGDNNGIRKSVSLYLFDEPDPRRKTSLTTFQQIVVRYPDGAHNCEAVTVDMRNRRILLLSKTALVASMYEVSLPDRVSPGEPSLTITEYESRARVIQQVAIPLATGMDLCSKTGDLWVCNYLQAYRYPATKRSSLESRLGQVPQMHRLPALKQVEAIAVDQQGQVWVTSEGVPAKIQRVLFEN